MVGMPGFLASILGIIKDGRGGWGARGLWSSLETKRHNVMWSHKCLPQRVLDLALPSREWAPKWEVQEVREVREHRMQQQRRQR